MIPQSELLNRDERNPTWVRVTFRLATCFGFCESTSRFMVRRTVDKAPTAAGAFLLPPAVFDGRTAVADFRITRTQRAGPFFESLERISGRLDVVDSKRLTRSDLQKENLARDRDAAANESQAAFDKERKEKASNALKDFIAAAKFARGIAVLVVLAAIAWATAPLLKAAAPAAARLFKKRRA